MAANPCQQWVVNIRKVKSHFFCSKHPLLRLDMCNSRSQSNLLSAIVYLPKNLISWLHGIKVSKLQIALWISWRGSCLLQKTPRALRDPNYVLSAFMNFLNSKSSIITHLSGSANRGKKICKENQPPGAFWGVNTKHSRPFLKFCNDRILRLVLIFFAKISYFAKTCL